MDQKVAMRLFLEGAVFVFLGVPEGTEFGVDMKSWSTGERFRGVKMIPPGVHFIHYNATSDTGDFSPKVGFFHYFKKSEFVVKKWDAQMEHMSSDPVNEEEVVRLKENIINLDMFLGPYPYDILEKWEALTSHISENLMKKLIPKSGEIRSALELLSCSDADRPRGIKKVGDEHSNLTRSTKRTRSSITEEVERQFLPDLKPLPGTEIRFSTFPEQNYPEGSSPSEVTQHSLDSSYTLEKILAQHAVPIDFIGELEFSYICFLVGHCLDAFEHWKKLVSLLCSCKVAITKHRILYDVFASLLEVQIAEIPEEFLADIVTNNNFVYLKLRDFFRNVQDSSVDGRLKTKSKRFEQNLTNTYGWDFSHLESEDEDEAPVIVET